MKKLLLYLFVPSVLFGFSQQITLLENQPIYIEYRTGKKMSSGQFLFVLEMQTKKKASVELLPDDKYPDRLKGFFRIKMNMEKYPSQLIEFITKTGNKLFAYVLPNTNSNEKSVSVVLFDTEKQWQDFSLEFMNQAALELKAKMAELSKTKTLTKDQVQNKKETLIRLNDRVQEQARLSIEAQEAIKREQLAKELASKSEAEKKFRIAKAKELANSGETFYKVKNYKQAKSLFEQASEFDPENELYLYKLGITEYQLGNYNRSLSLLSMSEGGPQNSIEHRFFVAQNHFKLKELEKAAEEFEDVQSENDPNISPTAAFYAGAIELQNKKYEKAKSHFEFVMDQSKDPKLDNEAEAQIEEIDRILNFLNSQKEVFKYSFYIGPQYDGNVLNIASQNLAINSEAIRFMYGGSFTYNYLRDLKYKMAAELFASDMYSWDKNFKADSTIQSADPLQFGLRLPNQIYTKIGKKSISMLFQPYMTQLNMSNDGGSRNKILSSLGMSSEFQWDQGPSYFHVVKLDYVADTSYLEVSDEADNQTATRVTFDYNGLWLLNSKGDKSVLGDVGYIANQAKGDNAIYNKTTLALSYQFNTAVGLPSSLRLENFSMTYPKHSSSRKDSANSLTYQVSKAVNKVNTYSASLAYNQNSSNLDSYTYNKWVLGFLYTYSGSILNK